MITDIEKRKSIYEIYFLALDKCIEGNYFEDVSESLRMMTPKVKHEKPSIILAMLYILYPHRAKCQNAYDIYRTAVKEELKRRKLFATHYFKNL